MTDPLVDDALVGASSGAVRTERMPEQMPATELFPLGAEQRLLEMVTGFLTRQRLRRRALLTRFRNILLNRKRVDTAGMFGEPVPEHFGQQWRELGYVFVSGIWPNDVMDAAAAAAEDLAPFPNPDGTPPPPKAAGGVFGNGSTQGDARPGAFPYHNPNLSASKLGHQQYPTHATLLLARCCI